MILTDDAVFNLSSNNSRIFVGKGLEEEFNSSGTWKTVNTIFETTMVEEDRNWHRIRVFSSPKEVIDLYKFVDSITFASWYMQQTDLIRIKL